MTGKERFDAVVKGTSDHCGFWHGDPNPKSLERIYSFFNVKDDFEQVLRLQELLGPTFIVSPSHESLLPNVPPENISALAKAAGAEEER